MIAHVAGLPAEELLAGAVATLAAARVWVSVRLRRMRTP